MKRNATALVLLLLVWRPHSPFCETAVSDERGTWRIGVSEFISDGLSAENGYLSSSYALLIRETLSRLETHIYSGEEADAYRKVIIGRERDRLMKQRDEALVAKDTAFVSGKIAEGTVGERAEELADSVRRLDTLNLTGIQVELAKKIEMVDGAAGPLLPKVTASPAVFAETNDLDMLVFGTIAEIESYLFVDVRVYLDAFGELPPPAGPPFRESA